jgi:16S rRNA (cytosine1402-N4)-methyltransferase
VTGYHHESVLLEPVLAALSPADGEIHVDCTLGGGGHAVALLRAARCTVVGIDRDPAALEAARAAAGVHADRLITLRGSFSELPDLLDRQGIGQVHGVFADLGVSSHQLDTPARGFSFRTAGPVDMRMDPDAPVSAADLVNHWPEDDLADLVRRLGEERQARKVAKAIVAGRPFRDTKRLAEVVAAAVGGAPSRIHPATRTFQALRMAVNRELEELEVLLPAALHRLVPGGRLAILTFHSLEDRLVKRFLDQAAGKGRPRDPYGNPIGPVLVSLRPPVVPADDDPNPRARSARLRSAVRLPWNTR